MVVPRPWSAIEKQRDLDQARLIAKPNATDTRFKFAAFCLFGCWLTIVFSLYHSIKHYKPRNRGIFNRVVGFIRYTPNKFLLTIPLSLALVGYTAASAFDFDLSPLKYHDPDLGMMYGLGWGSIILIILVYEIAGYIDPNEDRELIRQRRIRGAEIDQEMGITKKPHWWSRLHTDNTPMNVQDRIARNVGELGGGRATAKNLERSIEMGNMPVSKRQDVNKPAGNVEAIRMAANLLFPAQGENIETQERFTDHPDTARGRSDSRAKEANETTRQAMSDRSDSHHSAASGLTLGAKPQQVRSMLDV
jgi:hypothetical protein